MFALLAVLNEISKTGWEYSADQAPAMYAAITALIAIAFLLNEWWEYQDSEGL